MEPYKGLQPYTEENEDIFFGRDAEKAILIDKILSDKLTLLFAATGVGKSSLLQAAVMPELKRPARENLDVVYYNDWVSPPLAELKKTILDTLQKQGKLDAAFTIEENLSLQEFLHICVTFASEPLVIILDQFEEFFQYHRYSEHFTPFIRELSDAIRDKDTSIAFLISMREDFALNLNTFKGYLPNTLFENYYRLEKLEIEAAKQAIEEPVKKFGFRYEEGLLDNLLKDLAEQERESRIGTQKEIIPEHAPSFVEPPNVQIVCTQLWQEEKENPEKVIRKKTYKEHEGAKGFIGNYFTRVINRFSLEEKKIASKAFNHLVTPRGTKMAYPVKDLSDRLRVEETALDKVLAKLEKARVMRSQKRKEELWYELYHDTFSGIIYRWNSDYKTKQRTKRALIGTGIGIIIFLLLFVVYDIIVNLTNYHLRLSPKKEISDQIEIYRGKLNTLDITQRQKYKAETFYKRSQIEPDQLFVEKPVAEYENLNRQLIKQLPIIERISAYWQTGEIQQALELAKKYISKDNMTTTRAVIDILATFCSQKTFDKIWKEYLDPSQDASIREEIISVISSAQLNLKSLFSLLDHQDARVRDKAVVALGRLGSEQAIASLEDLVKDGDPEVRRSVALALGCLGSDTAIKPLIALLQDEAEIVRDAAKRSLELLDSDTAVNPLITLLKDEDAGVQCIAAELLGQLGSDAAVEPLRKLIQDSNRGVRFCVVEPLSRFNDELVVKPLVEMIKDQHLEYYERAEKMRILEQFRGEIVEKQLIALLENKDTEIRRIAAELLGQFGSDAAVEPLINLLKDEDAEAQCIAAELLGQFGNDAAVEPLIAQLKDEDVDVQISVIRSLGRLGNNMAVKPLNSN